MIYSTLITGTIPPDSLGAVEMVYGFGGAPPNKFTVCFFSVVDEYKLKEVEKVKYMHGEEERMNTRNQENLVRFDAHQVMFPFVI